MQIVFLGTGGGRMNLIKQFRGTGGFRINTTMNIHVDPGPGALLASRQYKQDPTKIGLLFVSHVHIDHSNDANLMIEAMTDYALKKKGILLGSKSVIKGTRGFDPSISRYHLKKLAKNVILKPGSKFNSKGIGITATKTKHDDKSTIGFILEAEGKRIGYTSDTEYFKELGKMYVGCDYLIVNNLKPKLDGIPDHLSSEDTIKILKDAQPNKAILSHLGVKFMDRPAEDEANMIEQESGVRTIAARDGMKFGELEQFQKVYRLNDVEDDEDGVIKIQQGNREEVAGKMGR
ncbi:MAG: MBL fold metallo-hydrolase [Candidatus Micrarchaeota archaeon]